MVLNPVPGAPPLQLAPADVFEPRMLTVAGGRSLALCAHAVLMGILNVTPDSFSDGGKHAAVDQAVAQARRMAMDGAAIIDIGGESTRPGAEPVSAAEEQRRILPVIEALSGTDSPLISVDTYRAETARLALAAGAHIINDVWGLQREPDIARVACDAGAAVIIMHTGRERTPDPYPLEDQFQWFARSLEIARSAGLGDDALVLDPGFGFAKDGGHNIHLMRRFAGLHRFGLPLLAGTSRKRFLGTLTGHEDAAMRDVATAATSVVLRLAGAALFRVHDVAINKDALAVADAMVTARTGFARQDKDCPS